MRAQIQPSHNMHISAYFRDNSHHMPVITAAVHCVPITQHLITSSTEQKCAVPHSSRLDQGQDLSSGKTIHPRATWVRWCDLDAK